MPTRRPKMRDVREVMRQHREGAVPMREIARMTGVARSTLQDMILRLSDRSHKYRLSIAAED
jgi:transposase-like protein